ncbi:MULTISPECIES: hypothetical protein [Paenibacillus]|uniref:hypothetical protein n=1 Tax=Paenibacillus TaxID=44249 RepID=UPI00117F85DB|nr:hypothetical protein [Paenibacillus rhizosphaerae]
MKIITRCMLTIFLLYLVFPLSSSNASSSRGFLTTYSSQEIKDIDVLFERARSGISDINDNEISNSTVVIKNEKSGETKDAKAISTTQLLKIETKEGATKKSYSTTYFTSGYNGSGHDDGDLWDPSSYGVKAYSTLYWDFYYDNDGATYKDITSASGGWTISDSAYYLRNKTVRLFSYGSTPNHTSQTVDKSFNISDSTNTFSVTAPSEWQPVVITDKAYRNLGVSQSCTIYDGTDSSSWSFSYEHKI